MKKWGGLLTAERFALLFLGLLLLADALLIAFKAKVDLDALSVLELLWLGSAVTGGLAVQMFIALRRFDGLRARRHVLFGLSILFSAMPLALTPNVMFSTGLPIACALLLYSGAWRWSFAAGLLAADLVTSWITWPGSAWDDDDILSVTLVDGMYDAVWTAVYVYLLTRFVITSLRRTSHQPNPVWWKRTAPTLALIIYLLAPPWPDPNRNDVSPDTAGTLVSMILIYGIMLRVAVVQPRSVRHVLAALAVVAPLITAATAVLGWPDAEGWTVLGATAMFLMPGRRGVAAFLAAAGVAAYVGSAMPFMDDFSVSDFLSPDLALFIVPGFVFACFTQFVYWTSLRLSRPAEDLETPPEPLRAAVHA